MSALLPSHTPHWSKEFVEHLRTVHFALIAASIGLIIIGLSAKTYKSSIAIRELRQILELRKLWKPKWIPENGDAKDITPKPGQPGFSETIPPEGTFLFEISEVHHGGGAWIGAPGHPPYYPEGEARQEGRVRPSQFELTATAHRS
jgi:hypothetical protein